MKDRERWARINAIFDQVIEAPVDQRDKLLEDSAGGDNDLLQVVRDLVAASERTDHIFDVHTTVSLAELYTRTCELPKLAPQCTDSTTPVVKR